MTTKDKFTFAISLSVLNHLGRNLYRSFVTVLGEAISNAWDADADNVWIHINKEKNNFVIIDDGIGMSKDDFQNKFLKIGYSKRKDGISKSSKGRPFIGRKGIGKLALLSCAEKITVISKVNDGEYVGGTIDNSGLDAAISDDLNPDDYQLEDWSVEQFSDLLDGHEHGTIIQFSELKAGIRNSIQILKKLIALYFRFSIHDPSFRIFLDGETIDHESLSDLAGKTEFLWTINDFTDPFINNMTADFTEQKNETKNINLQANLKGFIASVEKPRNLTITGMNERVGIDFFVNGRLRERDILKHIPTSRVAENYFYGQIHFDEMDDTEDRFTSSREDVVADDRIFKEFLEAFRREVVLKVIEDWDTWRIKHREDGDPENEKISPKERKSRELFNTVTRDFDLPKSSPNAKKVSEWVDELANDAQFNFSSYAECFVSENLIRNYISDEQLELSPETIEAITDYKEKELKSKERANISIELRRSPNDLSYLSMGDLANFVDKGDKIKDASLSRDATEYKPMRDAVAHTALLSDTAKNRLTSVYENIKGRIINLLSK